MSLSCSIPTVEAIVHGEPTRCALLACYRRDVEKLVPRKRWLRTRSEPVREERPMRLVFVPYRRDLKEIVEIDEGQLRSAGEVPPGAFVRAPTFVSRCPLEEYELDGQTVQIFCEQEIRDFYGYAFAAENPAFLAAAINGLPEVSLELLYRQNPAWATLSFGNEGGRACPD